MAYPLLLGVAICVPEVQRGVMDPSEVEAPTTIRFSSKKIVLNSKTKQKQTVVFSLQSGDKVHVSGLSTTDSNKLAQLLSGNIGWSYAKLWGITINGKRSTYQQYSTVCRSHCLRIDPLFQSDVSILQWLHGGDPTLSPSSACMNETIEVIANLPQLQFALALPSGLATTMNNTSFTIEQRGMLQLARCFTIAPAIVVVEQTWFTLNSQGIIKLLQAAMSMCPNTMFVCFTEEATNSLEFTKQYVL